MRKGSNSYNATTQLHEISQMNIKLMEVSVMAKNTKDKRYDSRKMSSQNKKYIILEIRINGRQSK